MEHPELDWDGRANYLIARMEERRLEVYAMDLVWGIARRYYDDLPKPSEIWTNKEDKADHRSGDQIIDDLIKKLTGGE